jgi:tyrosyl-tRNA synthetase
MQMADIAVLGVDAAVGGIDQRKIHMLAREYLPDKGYSSPVCIHLPIISGTDGKKMSSSQGNDISIADSEENIRKKLKKAFCPPEAQDNPVLQMLQFHIFPRVEAVTVERQEKFGGNVTFNSYEAILAAYLDGSIHPADLKETAARYLIEILAPVREYLAARVK